MGKKKLVRFRDLETLSCVFQPPFEEVYDKDYRLKGMWKTGFFGNKNPLVLELGCGKGEYTVGLARMNPEKNYIGLDIKGARIWTGARLANDEGLENVAFLRTRIDFIASFFARDEVDEIWITFPDPQDKKRRRRKRLTGARFLNLYRQVLNNNGPVHLKTDNSRIYTYTLGLVKQNKLVVERDTDDLYNSGWNDETVSIQTYYESRFRLEGSKIHFIQFRLPSDREIEELRDEVE